MDRTTQKVFAGALFGAVLLVAEVGLPHSAARAASPAETAGLLASGLGCGPAETLVGAGSAGLLARVRAEAAGAATRRGGKLGKARPVERRPAARQAARAGTAAPRTSKLPAQRDREARPAVLRSFYTCDAASAPNLAEGTGWRLVGPLRRG